MSILSRVKISPQQRFDLEDFFAQQSAQRTDSKLWTKSFLSATNLVLSGFAVSGIGLNSATVAMTGAALIVPQNAFDFSYFISAPSEPDVTITDAQLVDGVRNYVEATLTTQDGTPLTKAFWDPEANNGVGAEFNQIVDTITDLKISFITSTGGFSGDPNNIPIAIIDTNGSGVIKVILDRREIFGRLAKPSNINNSYAWGTKSEPAYSMVMTGVAGTFTAGELVTIGTETATVVAGGTTTITFNRPTGISFVNGSSVVGLSSGATGTVNTIAESFGGVDKSLGTQKNINDALMTEIKLMKGTLEWYSDAYNSNNGLTKQVNSLMVQAVVGAKWSWSGTALSITDTNVSPTSADILGNIRLMGDSRVLNLLRQDGQASTAAIPIADGQVLFVALPASGTRSYSNAGSGATNFQTVARTSYVSNDTNYWIAFRQGSLLYVRNQGELRSGESGDIGDNIPQTLLDNIGLIDEVTPASYSSNIRGTAGQSLVARLGVLTDAVGDSQEDRSAYLRSDEVITWSGTQLSWTQPMVLEIINTKNGTTSVHNILVAGSPLSLNANEYAYISINRASASESVSLVRSSITPIPAQLQANKDIFVLFKRIDVSGQAYLHIPFHKQVLNPGQAVRLGASGAGSGGLLKVKAVNAGSTVLPTPGASYSVDGVTVANGDYVLFTALSSGNNRVYEVQGVGTSITFTAKPLFNNSNDPSGGDTIIASGGNSYGSRVGVYYSTTTDWQFNKTLRMFNGTDYVEMSAIITQALVDNQVSPATIFSIAATNSENIIIDFSVARNNSSHEVGTMWLSYHTGTNTVSLSQGGAVVGTSGITFSATYSAGNIVLSYTSTNESASALMKYTTKRWADASGAGPGLISYPAPTGDLTLFGSSNLMWNTDGGGSIGSSSGNRPDFVNAKSGMTIGGEAYRTRQFSVNTTNATPTTLGDVLLATDTTMLIEIRVVARRTGGASGSNGDSAFYVQKARAKNIGGTVTIVYLNSEESEDQLTWDTDLTVSGANARIQVTGAASNNITWSATVISQQV